MCRMRKCSGTCIKSLFFKETQSVDGERNDCLVCDDKMCAPDFLECAGVNRRRSGIVNDNIETEVCELADFYWKYDMVEK